jgi:hypothetical protein
VSFWKDYCYVDAHYDHPVTKKPTRWERLRVNQLSGIVTKANNLNVLASVQRFKDAVSLLELHRKDEAAIKAAKKKGPEAEAEARDARIKESHDRPDKQVHYHGLYFDFDCDPDALQITEDEALARSLTDTRALVARFRAQWPEVREQHIQVWYSGRKGFHVMVRPEVFGIRPHKHLSYIVKLCAWDLRVELKLETLDKSVYTIPRQWRIGNSLHPKSGRYKVELGHTELMTWPIERIRELARGPRNPTSDPLPSSHIHTEHEFSDIPVDPAASTWWWNYYQTYEAEQDLKNIRPRRPIVVPVAGGEFPVCIQDLMKNGPKPGANHARNRVVLPLIGFFKDAGLDQSETAKQIADFNDAHYPDTAAEQATRAIKDKGIIGGAYRPDGNLRFACRFIRSLSGPGESGQVACVGEAKCPWVGDPVDQEPATVPILHLSETSKGCYIGTKIKTEIHVAAMAKAPFGLPIRGIIECEPDPEAKICERCPNNLSGGKGKLEWSVDADDRLALEMVNVNDAMRKGALKKKIGIPEKCFRHRIINQTNSNLEEIQVIPLVDHAQSFKIADTDEEQIAAKNARHVVASAYHLGHGIEANKKYRVEATIWAHPKDQRMCMVFDKKESAQDDIANFSMTPELYDKLRIFQVRPGQSIEDKLKEIHSDLTANVHQIGGRMLLSIAVDLAYHSVIGFKVFGKPEHKGWFELLVMGDSATGKSTLVERLKNHYGLGELVSGEDSKRTGLVYASIQMQGQWVLKWGKVPQQDRRLLIIDEFSGIPAEEVSKMTQLRSTGKALAGGVNSEYETWARTRLIFLTNPRDNGGMLAGFNFGIQSIQNLFKDAADLRRVDLAVIVEKDEVSTSMLNKRWDQTTLPHQYTANLCQSLVLWAWSREPHQVKWQDGAEDTINAWSNTLGDTYNCDILLAERSDLKHKIARISCAVAARLFSTDLEGKHVLVTKEHVEYAALFMDRAYRSQSMSYFEYARRYKQDNDLTQERSRAVRQALMKTPNYDHTISVMLTFDHVTRRALYDSLNFEKADFDNLWRFLMAQPLIMSTPKGYRKTVAFTKLLKSLGGAKTGYDAKLADNFEVAVNQTASPEPEPLAPDPHWSDTDTQIGGEEPPFASSAYGDDPHPMSYWRKTGWRL